MARARGWCFTIQKCEKENLDLINSIECQYIIVGDETAPTTKKKHWQGYMYYDTLKSFKQIQKLLPKGTHIEHAKGTAFQNQTYCSKEAILFEKGDPPMQGKRTDLALLREAAKGGASLYEMIETSSSIQGAKCSNLLLSVYEPKRHWKPMVYWLWGPPGTSKSVYAESLCKKEPWWSNKSLRWWNDYDAHENVIIDDFRSDYCTFHELLRILDRFPYSVELKGGSRQLLAKQIIITSPLSPQEVYQYTSENMNQLLRRIDEIIKFPRSKSF